MIEQRKYNFNSRSETSQLLNSILKQGNFVKIETTSPHAMVVANFRIICAGGIERLQYQTLDSLYDTQWSISKRAGDWVDGNKLLDELEPSNSFSWLAPKVDLGFSYQVPSQISQNGPTKVPITEIIQGSPAYNAGLRNGMNYRRHEFDAAQGIVSIWVDDGPELNKKITYSP